MITILPMPLVPLLHLPTILRIMLVPMKDPVLMLLVHQHVTASICLLVFLQETVTRAHRPQLDTTGGCRLLLGPPRNHHTHPNLHEGPTLEMIGDMDHLEGE